MKLSTPAAASQLSILKTVLLLSALFLAAGPSVSAQSAPLLLGNTQNFGSNFVGTILSYTGGNTSLNGEFNFPSNPEAGPASITLTEAPNGELYGLSTYDGTNGYGSLFKYDVASNTYTAMVYLTDTAYYPQGSLLLASNGLMYGLTPYSDSTGGGVLFSYAVDSSAITILSYLPAGATPIGSLIQASDGNLYGMTQQDGTNGGGTIFQYNITTGTYTVMYNLPANAYPLGSLLEAGADTLYGLTQDDGTNLGGTLFRYVIGAATDTVLVNLSTAANPAGSLIRATDGNLYGLTASDGANNQGTIFSYNTSTGTYTDLHDFGAGTDGAAPEGSLMQASDGNLYAMTYAGGANGGGTIFQYNIATSTYTREFDLTPTSGEYPGHEHLTQYIAAPLITAQPSDLAVCTGSSATFISADSGLNTTLQWQVSTDLGATFSNINGSNSDTLSFTAAVGQNGYQYRMVVTNIGGSDTSAAATITVYAPATDTITAAICPGAGYTLGTTTYTAAGSYSDTLTGASVNGCDSIVTLNLSIYPAATDTITASICPGAGYTLGTATYTAAGSYSDTLTGASVNGCDSIVTLNLSIYPAATDTITASICPGAGYALGTATYTAAGSYSDTLTGASVNGCDSIVTLNLSIYPAATDTITASICPGAGYTLGTATYTAAGSYSDTLTGASVNGCDSIVTLNLSIYPAATDTITASICPGAGYTLGTATYTAAGSYSDTLTGASVNGCDSIVTLNLSIYPAATDTITASICPGAGYTLGTTTYTAAGSYSDTLTGASVNGCDSIVTLNLSIYPAATDTITASICPGAGYTLGTATYTAAGSYSDTLTGASVNGCDSIVTLNLSIYPAATDTVTAAICPGAGYTLGTTTYTAAGSYSDTLTGASVNGCDSIVTLNLSIYPVSGTTISATICQGSTYTFGNHTYGTTGTFMDTLAGAAVHGCDSIVTLDLTVSPLLTPSVTIVSTNTGDTICDNTMANLFATGVNGGSNPDFQWQRNGVNIGNSATYIANTILNGDVYTCIMTSTAQCLTQVKDTSNAITFTVIPYPSVTIGLTGGSSACSGDSIGLKASGGTSYVWSTGDTTQSIYATTGSYTVTATGAYSCTAGSLPYDVAPHAPLSDSVALISDTLVLVSSGSGEFYQWYFDDSIISGVTGTTYFPTQSGSYQVSVIDSFGCLSSSQVFIFIGAGITPIQSGTAVHLYPNPNSGVFTLDFSDDGPKLITITDALGRVIVTRQVTGLSEVFDIGSRPDGIYNVTIAGARTTSQFKFSLIR